MSFHIVTNDGRVAVPNAYRTRDGAEDDRPAIERVVGGPCHVIDSSTNDYHRVSALECVRFDRPPRMEHLA